MGNHENHDSECISRVVSEHPGKHSDFLLDYGSGTFFDILSASLIYYPFVNSMEPLSEFHPTCKSHVMSVNLISPVYKLSLFCLQEDSGLYVLHHQDVH